MLVGDAVKTINERFIPVNFLVTDIGMPEDVEGLAFVRKLWDEHPWTRIQFASDFVLDSTGTLLLAASGCAHPGAEAYLAGFRRMLVNGASRQERLREHPHGSPEARATIEEIRRTVEAELLTTYPCANDPDFFTKQALAVFSEHKLAAIFRHHDPRVRLQATELVERQGERGPHFVEGIAALLDDEHVRRAAERALPKVAGAGYTAAGTEPEHVRGWWAEAAARYRAASELASSTQKR